MNQRIVRKLETLVPQAFVDFRTKGKVRRLIKQRNQIFLEVGAGRKKGADNWLTTDIKWGCDIPWDLRNGIPFPDGTVHKVYSSHFMEHLTYEQGQGFLKECVRVLAPGGIFSVCVPNARIYLEGYLNGNFDMDKFITYKPAFNNTTKIDIVNYHAHMNEEHKYMFDEENLVHRLESVGLKDVHIREFDPELDLEGRDYESIYAQGTK